MIKKKISAAIIVLLIFVMTFCGCKKDDKVNITPSTTSEISETSETSVEETKQAATTLDDASVLEATPDPLVEYTVGKDDYYFLDSFEAYPDAEFFKAIPKQDFAFLYDNFDNPEYENAVINLSQLWDNSKDFIGLYGMCGSEALFLVDGDKVYKFDDFCYRADRFQPEFYKGDYDNDGDNEIAAVELLGSGTGINIEGIRLYDIEGESLVEHRTDNDSLADMLNSILFYDYHEDYKYGELYLNGYQIGSFGIPEEFTYVGLAAGQQMSFLVRDDGIWLRAVIGINCEETVSPTYDTSLFVTAKLEFEDGIFGLKYFNVDICETYNMPREEYSPDLLTMETFRMEADITHDGVLDTVVNEGTLQSGWEDIGPLNWLNMGYPAHIMFVDGIEEATTVGLRSIELYIIDRLAISVVYDAMGRAYILESRFNRGQGFYSYEYKVYSLTHEGEVLCIDTYRVDADGEENLDLDYLSERIHRWTDNKSFDGEDPVMIEWCDSDYEPFCSMSKDGKLLNPNYYYNMVLGK